MEPRPAERSKPSASLWGEAFRQLRRNPLAMTAFVVLAVYFTVALLDLVPVTMTDPQGAFVRWGFPAGSKSSRLARLLERSARSADGPVMAGTLVDWMLRRVREREVYREPAFSPTAPTADEHAYAIPPQVHPLGTDVQGEDVLWKTVKSVTTAITIGVVTTLIAVPIGLLMGILAGYFGGWVDDAVQYVYQVLASIPGPLLLIAFLFIVGKGLWMVCFAMGITGWVALCRLIRGETLKLREADYVTAARAFGVTQGTILARHILPNLSHLIVIYATLRFSTLVLSEVFLTYIGIGVEADTFSWGTMIRDARQELLRYPCVWWNLAAATGAIFFLVLSANILGDALRDALDPKLRQS